MLGIKLGLNFTKNVSRIAKSAIKPQTVSLPIVSSTTGDIVQFGCKKGYEDIVVDMLKQRQGLLSCGYKPGFATPQDSLGAIKDVYLSENYDIRRMIIQSKGKLNPKADRSYSQIMALDKTIAQNQIPRDVTLYRVATPYDFGLHSMSPEQFIKQFYKDGKMFTIPIYPETTLDKEVAENFLKSNGGCSNIIFKINAPKGTNGIYMEKLPCKFINNEEEILLPRDSVYQFKSHKKDGLNEIVEIDLLKRKPLFRKVHNFWQEVDDSYWQNATSMSF